MAKSRFLIQKNSRAASPDIRGTVRCRSLSETFAQVAIAFLILAAVTIVAQSALHIARSSGWEVVYPETFEASVYLACGQGYKHQDPNNLDPNLGLFLSGETQSLSCDELTTATNLIPANTTLGTFYQQVFTGFWWRLTGVSWWNLDLLVSLFLGLSAVLIFFTLKLWLSSILAVVITLLGVIPAVPFLTFPRDLMKAPFMLAAILFAFYMALRKLRPAVLLTGMLALGLLIGVGYGFRPDVLVTLPLVTAVALIFRKQAGRQSFIISVVGVALLGLGFFVSSAPARSATTEHYATGHFALLGLSDATQKRQFGEGSSHSILQHHFDTYSFAAIGAHGNYLGFTEDFEPYGRNFGRVSQDLYLQALSTFPGSLMRNLAATGSEVLNVGISGIVFTTNTILGSASGSNYPSLRALSLILWAIGLISWIAFLFFLLTIDRRLGFFATFITIFLTTYPIFQFESRHIFYLSFLTWIPLGTFLSEMLSRKATRARWLFGAPTWPAAYAERWRSSNRHKFAFATLVSIALFFFATYAVTAAFERRNFSQLVSTYQSIPTATAQLISRSDGSYSVPLPQEVRTPWWSVLRITSNTSDCDFTSAKLQVEIDLVEAKAETRIPTRKLTWTRPITSPDGFVAFIPILESRENIEELSIALVSGEGPQLDKGDVCPLATSWLVGEKAPTPPFAVLSTQPKI